MSLGLRHWSRRKKAGYKHVLDILIYPAAIAGPLALLPQAVQLYTTHDASGLSLATWAVLVCLNLLWLLYGLVHREYPIVLTNAALAVLNFAVVWGILLYR